MSWSFQLQKVNQSFETIAAWYHEFMHRTELCFRAMNQRLIKLEEREGPSDEQLERVLRKILADKFSDGDGNANQLETPIVVKEEEHFVQPPRKNSMIRPVRFDVATLLVDPEAVPSKAYAETFDMLQKKIVNFPDLGTRRPHEQDEEDERRRQNAKHPRRSNGV